jgi:ribosomal protein L32
MRDSRRHRHNARLALEKASEWRKNKRNSGSQPDHSHETIWAMCAACGWYHRDDYVGPCSNPRECFTLGAAVDGTLRLY